MSVIVSTVKTIDCRRGTMAARARVTEDAETITFRVGSPLLPVELTFERADLMELLREARE